MFARGKQTCVSGRQSLQQALPVGGAESGAGVPALAGFVVAIVSLRDVAERSVRWRGVEKGIDEASGFAESLIDARD